MKLHLLLTIILATVLVQYVQAVPADPISTTDSVGNEINPSLNQQVFFNYNIANGDKSTRDFGIDLFIILDDTNEQIFYKKQQLQLKPDTWKTVTWSFTPTKAGNYTAKIIENGISHSYSFVIEDFTDVNPVCTNPEAIAVNSKTNLIYVTCWESYWNETKTDSVYVIRGSDNRVLNVIPVGKFPSSIAVNPNSNKVYVTNFESKSVTVIDGITNNAISNITNIGYHPYRVAADPNTNMVYVVNDAANPLFVIDGLTDTVVSGVQLFRSDANGLAINPTTHRAYISHDPTSYISVVDLSTNSLIDVLTVGDRISGLAVNPDANLLYVLNLGNISVLDPFTNETIANITTNTYGSQIAVNPVTNKIYTANGWSNSTTIIDGKTNKIEDIIEVGFIAESLAVNPTTNMIYVVNRGSNSISVIDGTTDKIVTEFQAKSDTLQKSHHTLSPLTQFKLGVPALNVKCNDGFQLVIKWEDASPACVKHSTVNILTQRGWIWSTTPDRPIRIMARVQTTGHGGPAGWNPSNAFWMNIKSASTAYLFSFDICNKDSCTNQNFTPLNSINYEPNGYELVALSDELNTKWRVGDTVHIKLLVSTSTDNKTATMLDLGNSTIIP